MIDARHPDNHLSGRVLILLVGMLGAHLLSNIVHGVEPSKSNAAPLTETRFTTKTLRGRVVWMAEAAERLFGVKSVPEAKERTIALETVDGKLIPILEDVRGRAFRVDERLRKMDVELLVRDYERASLIQILGVYSLENNGKFEVDYWCDVCAIAMYEKKECECCQADNVLRKRPIPEK